jgi:hypothetical protein
MRRFPVYLLVIFIVDPPVHIAEQHSALPFGGETNSILAVAVRDKRIGAALSSV